MKIKQYSVITLSLILLIIFNSIGLASPLHAWGSGGTITDITVNGSTYRVHTFTESGTFTPPTGGATVEVLLVAGGGGGGSRSPDSVAGGAGGGAGGVIQQSLAVGSTPMTVVVGSGGAGATTSSATAYNGGNSTFGGLLAVGGGGGSSAGDARPAPGNGGSGGGSGASGYGGLNGGSGTAGQGYGGGVGMGSSPYRSGGGGGASELGHAGSDGGIGGDGVSSVINGTATNYGGGGGAGSCSSGTEGSGGNGGGGSGGSTGNAGTNGIANSGGGGGGSAHNTVQGGNGGTGIVIIRYSMSETATSTPNPNVTPTPTQTANPNEHYFTMWETGGPTAVTKNGQLSSVVGGLCPGGDALEAVAVRGWSQNRGSSWLVLGPSWNSVPAIVTQGNGVWWVAGTTSMIYPGFDESLTTLFSNNYYRTVTSVDTANMLILADNGDGGDTLSFEYGGVCYGTHSPTTGNVLIDGDMEQWYQSTGWQQVDFGTIQKNNGNIIPYTWDRINTSAEGGFPSRGWSYWWNNGDAKCGTGYHAVGKLAPINADTSQMGKGAASSIEQNFTWSGGTLYWRLSARGRFQRLLPPTPVGAAIVYIDGAENSYFLLNEQNLTVNWQTFSGQVVLPAGTYRVKLDAWNKDEFLKGTVDDGVVYYDDIYFSYTPVGGACADQVIETTPTPSFTGTPRNTATPTSWVGNWTPTPDGSPTPTENPEILNVWNCGFEAGRSSWGFNSSSSIGYAGGPRGAQHAIATGWWPSVYQNLTTRSAQIYVTAWVREKPYIRLVNRDTGITVDVYQAEDSLSDWEKISKSVYLPAGNWRLELNNAGQPGGVAYYDGVTVSYGSFATEAQSWCAVDPTPGPTPFVTLTPTPTGTRRPTSTPFPTYTAMASMTPNNTWTPGPSGRTATAEQATATAQGTPGSGEQTATYSSQATAAQGTATAQGTPAATTVPGSGGPLSGEPVAPGPQQPNGGQGANCIRPTDWWRLDNWFEYMGCDAKKFMSWGSGNTQQVQGIWNDLQRYEPFGTLAELDQANKAVAIIVNSYDWQGTGQRGTDKQPSTIIFDPQSTLLNGRPFSLTVNNPGPSYAVNCDLQIEQLLGWQLGKPICFVFDILYQQNLIQWFQFFINLLSIAALIAYVNNNFIKPGSY